jgi:cysteine-S-conjugate beta-lyase
MSQFDLLVDRRNTRSVKWSVMEQVYNIPDASDILPMWVADMDFKAPPEVLDAIQERLTHGILGYSYVCDRCKNAIVDWHEKLHQWTIDPATILFHQGVVPAIASIIETFSASGDKVAVMSPVYPPFFSIPTTQARTVLYAPMLEENGEYLADFEALEQTFKDGAKIFILCNPHNPAGIVWSKQDLETMIQLAIQYDVLILSDEIHGDLVFDSSKHIPLLSLESATQAKVVTTIAPTKTFNLAGIHAAMMVVPNNDLRGKLEQNALLHGQTSLNVFASAAVQAAYTYGAEWLVELKQYIMNNMQYVQEQLNTLSGIDVKIPAGTYLMWIDYRKTNLTEKEMMDRLLHVGKLALEPGTKYGEAGRGFLRMNVGCPFSIVQDGVARFKRALE